MISAALSLDEPEFDNILVFGTLGVNLLVTLFLKELLLLSVINDIPTEFIDRRNKIPCSFTKTFELRDIVNRA